MDNLRQNRLAYEKNLVEKMTSNLSGIRETTVEKRTSKANAIVRNNCATNELKIDYNGKSLKKLC